MNKLPILLILIVALTSCDEWKDKKPPYEIHEMRQGFPPLRLNNQTGETWYLFAEPDGGYIWIDVLNYKRKVPTPSPSPSN